MRYFLDTEYNGFGGALLSLALVPEDGSEEFYVTLECDDQIDPWVERHVVPFLDMVPEALKGPRLPRPAAAGALAAWLALDEAPDIVADCHSGLVVLPVANPSKLFPVMTAPLSGSVTVIGEPLPVNLHRSESVRKSIVKTLIPFMSMFPRSPSTVAVRLPANFPERNS